MGLLVVILVSLLCRVVGPATKGWKLLELCLRAFARAAAQRGELVDDEGGLGVGLDLVALRQGLELAAGKR